MLDLTARTLITEDDIRSAHIGAIVHVSSCALVTPLAADFARERHIQIERVAENTSRLRIAIGADHGGFEMKEVLKAVLNELGFDYQDFGTNSNEPVDYPDFAQAVALAVSRRKCDLGIMIDGASIGSCMTDERHRRRVAEIDALL